MTGRINGRTAIITGAGRGIGRAAAELFAREGAAVIVATRSAAPGEEVVSAIQSAGGKAMLVSIDIGSRAAVIELVAKAVAWQGGVDIVLHNAGAVSASSIAELSDDELEWTLAVNLKAAFWFAAESLHYLQQSGSGRLLLTSSITGNRQSHPGYAAYGASKAGLNGFIRQAGYEFAPLGVTVNGVEPGVTLSDSVIAKMSSDQLAAFASIVPRGKAGSSDDIAHALLFLASAEAAHITGQTIIVDGGQSLGTAFPKQ